MNTSALRCFLSQDNLTLHLDHYNNLVNLSSVIYKSIPDLKGIDIKNVNKIRLKNIKQSEFLPTFNNLFLHKLYFDSFVDKPTRCEFIRKWYSSEDDFLYNAYLACKNAYSTFICFFTHKDGRPDFEVATGDLFRLEHCPVLAVDLFEHSYFMDYGFDRDLYIRRAFSFLNLKKLSN